MLFCYRILGLSGYILIVTELVEMSNDVFMLSRTAAGAVAVIAITTTLGRIALMCPMLLWSLLNGLWLLPDRPLRNYNITMLC